MAEGLLKYIAGNRYRIFSAGNHPSSVHPNAIAVMKELKIDISNHTSEHIDKYIDKKIDIVITLCDNAKKECPVFPNPVNRIHWSIEDPFVDWDFNPNHLQIFRKTRKKIQNHIEIFLKMESL